MQPPAKPAQRQASRCCKQVIHTKIQKAGYHPHGDTLPFFVCLHPGRNRSCPVPPPRSYFAIAPCLRCARHVLFESCTVHHKTAVIPVDIPMRWEPRAKQQPTGLIAYSASQSRPVRVLYRHHEKSPQTECLAASFLVDIPSRWEPRTNKHPTGVFVAPPAAVPCCSSPVPPPRKKSQDLLVWGLVVEHCQRQSNL